MAIPLRLPQGERQYWTMVEVRCLLVRTNQAGAQLLGIDADRRSVQLDGRSTWRVGAMGDFEVSRRAARQRSRSTRTIYPSTTSTMGLLLGDTSLLLARALAGATSATLRCPTGCCSPPRSLIYRPSRSGVGCSTERISISAMVCSSGHAGSVDCR